MKKDNYPSQIFIIDLIIINISFSVYFFKGTNFEQIPFFFALLPCLMSAIWFIIILNSDIANINQQSRIFDSLKKLWIGYSVLIVTVIGIVIIFDNFLPHYQWLLTAALYSIIISSVFRVLYIFSLKHFISNGYRQKKVLLLGGGRMAEYVMNIIINNPEYGYKLYGILADNYHQSLPKGYYLGKLDRLAEMIRTNHLNEIIIALPLVEEELIVDIAEIFENEGVRLLIVPHFFRIKKNRISLCEIGQIPLISIRTEPLEIFRHRVIKRIFDFMFSLVALIITFPITIFIAIAIKVTSPGPIFFKQKRVGMNNIEFNMLKFRSMVVQEIGASNTKWTTHDDPRVTKIGKIIRKHNIDELPQFINVLTGDMSVVGPRPERKHFVAEFKNEINNYMVRHFTKAGITGWAQVNGWRGDTSIRKRIEHDLYYIENWNFFFDLKIIWMTVFGRKTHKNAY